MGDYKNLIFLVDDNIVFLNIGKTALQGKHNVITMPSSEKLLLSLKTVKPDLILLDVDMPGMSGYETIKQLKLDPDTQDIPVIFLTGKHDLANELTGLSLGAADYITKPISQALLLKRVELQLLIKEQRDELYKFTENLIKKVDERTNDISALQQAIIAWAAEVIEFRDEETGHHVDRVQKYLKVLLTEMECSEYYSQEIESWDVDAFLQSTLLHDVGKIKIRDDVLLKTTGLTDAEMIDMKRHSLYGKVLIESLQNKVPNQVFLEYAKVLAYSHHERWDGTGYPDGLKDEEIPLQARMMSIADVYDALISKRPYKEPYSHEDAMRIITESRGRQFDPNLVDLFERVSDKIKKISEVALHE